MIIDITQNLSIADDYKIINSFIKRSIGLMFSKPKNLIFIFKNNKTKSGIIIHTIFVFYTINILMLDFNKRVVEKVRLRPFSFYVPKHNFCYMIELANVNECKLNKVKIGDRISW